MKRPNRLAQYDSEKWVRQERVRETIFLFSPHPKIPEYLSNRARAAESPEANSQAPPENVSAATNSELAATQPGPRLCGDPVKAIPAERATSSGGMGRLSPIPCLPGAEQSRIEVEPVEVHDLVPSGDEIRDKFRFAILASVDLGNGSQL